MELLLALALAAAGGVNEIRVPEGFVRAEASPTRTSTPPPAPAGPSQPRDTAPGRDQRGQGSTSTLNSTSALNPTLTLTLNPTSASTSTSTSSAAQDACRDERSAYLKRLLHMAGVEVDDPISLLEGLAGPGGYQGALLTTPLGVLPGVDPIRPLAWDLELRSRARDLAACARAAAASAGR